MNTTPAAAQDLLPSADELRRLRWRCRRGLLENDLFVDRFFESHGDQLTVPLVQGLLQLMDLADNDLLDLLLARKEPDAELATPEVIRVLTMMRVPMAQEAAAAIRVK